MLTQWRNITLGTDKAAPRLRESTCCMPQKNLVPEDDVIPAESDFASAVLAERSKKQKKHMNVKILLPT